MTKNATNHVPGGYRRHGRRPMARTLLACAGLLAVLLVSAAPSGADEPALVPASADVVVSPSTLLLDGQSVVITGTGYPANSPVGMIECMNAVPGVGGCKMSTLIFATTDASGNFTTTFTVRRVLHIGSTTTDCADVGACRIGAGVPPDGTIGAGSDIQFDPSVPLPPAPILSANPSTGLLDGQSVTVTGSGYPSNTQVALIECLAPASTSGACTFPTFMVVTTDGSGDFSTPFTVRRLLRSGSTTTDCATPGTCEIGSGVMADGEFSAAAAIQFDPSAPLPPPPSLTLSQIDDLADGQSVTVTGTNYPPGETVGVVQCRVGATVTQGCDVPKVRYATPNSTGGFTITIQVSRMLVLGDVTTDCSLAGACIVGAGVLPVGNPGANSAIRFSSDPASAEVIPVFAG